MNNAASVTPEMIKQIAEMQFGGSFEGMIEHLEEMRGILISIDDDSQESLNQRMNLLKENDAYIGYMKCFIPPKQ